jgi:hypothetical protein
VGIEVFCKIEDQVVDIELLSHPPSIVDITHGTTTRVTLTTPQSHGDADDVVALFAQQECGHR